MNPVFVIGHRNPDTDSICSAICYAHLKRRLTGGEYIACRAGHVNAETKFVLERFGVEPPRYIKSFEPRLSDVQYREVPGISEELSLHRAWDYMNENDIQTLAVVDEDRRLKGLLTLGDIARFYIEDQDANALAEAKTSYRNLVDVLDGTLEVGDIDQRFEQGSVVVAAANPDVLEDYIGKNDMVILGNRYESQLCAIEMSAGCIVIGLGSKVSRTIRKLASENGVSIIATPYDTYTCVKVIGQAVPVRHVMRKKGLITFEPEETVEDVKRTVSKKRIRYYPLMDEQGRYVGMFSQRNLLDLERPSVILVDHNERDQAAEVASLDNALNNPDFTSVFAPIDPQASRKKMAKQAGVEPVILMEHVTKIYPAQPNKPALDDINIEIYPGEFVFLVGHSGSGKTTLLSTLNRDVKPTSGRILVAGQDLMKIKNRKVPFLRRQIGAVFQDFKLLPQKTAYENVAFALQCIGKPKGVIRSQVPEVLRLVGLADQMDSLPDQLSGGEQQRVAVARAMVNRPPLLICDEPTGNLDPAISLGIMKLLERINRTGTTVIVATHDREMVDSMHRRVIALEGGHVIRDQERGGYGNYGTN